VVVAVAVSVEDLGIDQFLSYPPVQYRDYANRVIVVVESPSPARHTTCGLSLLINLVDLFRHLSRFPF
jgi:hypothetical protein